MEQWKRGCEEGDMHRICCCWDDSMNANEEFMEDISKECNADDENDSEEVKALKVCLFSVVLLRAVTESICSRNDTITSTVSYNFPMINSMPLCNSPNIHSADTTPFWALPEPDLKCFLYEHRLAFAKSSTSGLQKPFPFPLRVCVSFLCEFPTFPSPVPTFRIDPSSFRVAPVRADSTFLIQTRMSHAYYAGGLTCDPLRFQAPVAFG
jgi:hypothetical protein